MTLWINMIQMHQKKGHNLLWISSLKGLRRIRIWCIRNCCSEKEKLSLRMEWLIMGILNSAICMAEEHYKHLILPIQEHFVTVKWKAMVLINEMGTYTQERLKEVCGMVKGHYILIMEISIQENEEKGLEKDMAKSNLHLVLIMKDIGKMERWKAMVYWDTSQEITMKVIF